LLTVTSLTSLIAAFVSGYCTVAVVSVVPFYLTVHETPSELVAASLLTLYLGRLLSQWPVGALSDRLDRRTVLSGLAIVVGILMIPLSFGPGEGKAIAGELGVLVQGIAFVCFLALGAALFPIYSVASSLAFDRADEESFLKVSTTLLIAYSVGSIAGPFCVMLLSAYIEDLALPASILAMMGLLTFVSLLRRSTVQGPTKRTPSRTIPLSSVEIAQSASNVIEQNSTDQE
jgi:MFS family permease